MNLIAEFIPLALLLSLKYIFLFVYFLNGESKTSGMKKMYEFRFRGKRTNTRFDEFVPEKFLNESTMYASFESWEIFKLQPKHENLPYKDC